jgi:IS5 family transposase
MSYTSPLQMSLFEMPFEQQLSMDNRWVKLSRVTPWDKIDFIYKINLSSGQGSGGALPSRLVIGALIIKFKENLSDEKTMEYIMENPYAQYYIGLSSFSTERPFDSSLLTRVRERLNWREMEEMFFNFIEKSYIFEATNSGEIKEEKEQEDDKSDNTGQDKVEEDRESVEVDKVETKIENRGIIILDSTVCPQDIAYPTDVNLLHETRLFLEAVLTIFSHHLKQPKPRTYSQVANKEYDVFRKKRKPSSKVVRKMIKKQLGCITRQFKHIDALIDSNSLLLKTLLFKNNYKLFLVAREIYRQQLEMFTLKVHSIANRIVNLKQPHVRPIVRGKKPISTEFGSKLDVFIDSGGYVHLHKLEWEASNDSKNLQDAANFYKTRFGYYPKEIRVDTQYRSKENKKWCDERGIIFPGRGPGRPPKNEIPVKEIPGNRNAIEGFFGHSKLHKGLARVRAKMQQTSELWIAMAFLVINLEKYLANTFLALFKTLLRALMGLHKLQYINLFKFNKSINYNLNLLPSF